jgi:hypothetical protein
VGELKLVVKDIKGMVKQGFLQTRVKGKIDKFELGVKSIEGKVKVLADSDWVNTKQLNKS